MGQNLKRDSVSSPRVLLARFIAHGLCNLELAQHGQCLTQQSLLLVRIVIGLGDEPVGIIVVHGGRGVGKANLARGSSSFRKMAKV